jgi:dihydropteroate synthase
MRPVFEWNIGTRSLPLGKRTLIMGVVNVTPDSFSDGGQHFDRSSAAEFGLRLLHDGADMVDIGGESTRPGTRIATPGNVTPGDSPARQPKAAPVSAEEEMNRIVPVITAIKRQRPDAIVSVDTYKSTVAEAAVAAGAEIVNDVSGFLWDPRMATILASLPCAAVLMHTRGRPDEWHELAAPSDIVVQVKRELRERSDAALLAGLKRDRLVLDPGFGFGKRWEENYPLLKRFEEFHQLRYPLLVGVSRKGFIGRALGRNGTDRSPTDRLYGTLAAETVAVLKGAHIIRTHDVRACADAVRIADLVVL